MRTDSHGFRLVAAAAAAGLALGPGLPWPVHAQPALPSDQPAADQQPSDQQAVDPPARVGRLARISGTVSFHAQGEGQWSPASRNFPVSVGDAFWTEPRAEAEIELGGCRIAMAGGTELDIGALDAATVQATQPQGEVYLHLRTVAPGETYTLQTPRAAVRIGAPGRYAIAAGDTGSPTLVTVLEGAAQVSGPGVALDAGPNQTVTIAGPGQGSDTMQATVGPARHDAFITAMLARERPPAHGSVALPPVVAWMPGGEDLAGYGAWESAATYGQVWYPQVAPGWAPYREGHWAYVEPWGWTWIDDAPWGFAPFHYGRWTDIDGRWAWVPGETVVEPGPSVYPVYAPAMVTFFGLGAGVALGAAFAAGSIGWLPLGPREVYHPWYHASPGYVRQVNVGSATNIAEINRPVALGSYVNRGAATVVPASAVVGSRPIARVARPADPPALAAAHPLAGGDLVRPTAATAGVSSAVARQLNLAPGEALTRHGAPGPAIRTQATGFAAPHVPPLAGPGRAEPLGMSASVPTALPALRRPGEIQAGPPPIAREPGVPAGAGPERGSARTGLAPSAAAPAGSAEPARLSHPTAVPPTLGTPAQPHTAVAEPHAGAPSPLVREPERTAVVHPPGAPAVVHQPTAPAAVHQPVDFVQHPARVVPPAQVHVAAPPQVHVAAPPSPPVHLAAPPRPQVPVAAPHFAPAARPEPPHQGEKRPGER